MSEFIWARLLLIESVIDTDVETAPLGQNAKKLKQRNTMKITRTILAVVATGFLGAALLSQANTITPSFQGSTTVGQPAGQTQFTYNLDVTSGQLQNGDSVTIFDFGGYVAGSFSGPTPATGSNGGPVGWVLTVQQVGGTPGGVDITGDNPVEFNLVFTWMGGVFNQPGQSIWTTFVARTTNNSFTNDGWTSRDHLVDAGTLAPFAQGTIRVPNAVPDGGTTVALLGLGLVGLGALRRKLGAI